MLRTAKNSVENNKWLRIQQYPQINDSVFPFNRSIFLAENLKYIYYTYKISMFAWYKELSVLLKCITCLSSLSDIEWSNIDTVRELLSIIICPISHSAAGVKH